MSDAAIDATFRRAARLKGWRDVTRVLSPIRAPASSTLFNPTAEWIDEFGAPLMRTTDLTCKIYRPVALILFATRM